MQRKEPRVRNLSALFPLSWWFGLMPCAVDDRVQRRLTWYTVVTHGAYRILNVSVLAYFLLTTETSASLLSLLGIVTAMKFLCATVHVATVIRNRERFLSLVSDCDYRDFKKNTYRKVTKFALGYCLYLWIVGQLLQRRWMAAFRDVFSSIDVIVPMLIIMQFCTFLKIATDKFKTARLHLVVYFYRPDDVLEEHLKNLENVLIARQLYSHQMFFCVCYFGFDFFVASYDTLERIVTMEKIQWVVATLSYSTLLLTTIFVLCRACEITRLKAEKFDQELFLLMNENKVLRGNIIAATTTYLIILMQFTTKE